MSGTCQYKRCNVNHLQIFSRSIPSQVLVFLFFKKKNFQKYFPLFHRMTVKARRVAVIGAGPAGAIATDALAKEQAFDVIRVFDRRAVVGGTW